MNLEKIVDNHMDNGIESLNELLRLTQDRCYLKILSSLKQKYKNIKYTVEKQQDYIKNLETMLIYGVCKPQI
jgi:hypothetical protein